MFDRNWLDDEETVYMIADEIGDCRDCWVNVARYLAALVAEHLSEDDSDPNGLPTSAPTAEAVAYVEDRISDALGQRGDQR